MASDKKTYTGVRNPASQRPPKTSTTYNDGVKGNATRSHGNQPPPKSGNDKK